MRYLTVIFIIMFVVGCGGSITTTSGSSQTTDQTIQQLINGGVQVSIEDTLAGTWAIKSYDLGEASSVISVSESDTVEITFPTNSTSNLMFATTELSTYSAPPLYDYETDIYGPKSDVEEAGNTYLRCDDDNAQKTKITGMTNGTCACGSDDTYCSIRPNCDTSEHSNACINYCQTYVPDSDIVAIDGLVNATLEYEIIETGVDPILKFTLFGNAYTRCCGTNPDACTENNEDYTSYEEQKKTNSYIIKGADSRTLAIETDNEYIILIKQ